jgi:Fusaric acid resistance protein-like
MNANMRWHHLEGSGDARARLAASRDLLAATDPGLNRFFAAVQTMTGIAVTIAVVYGFMQLTKVLWIHPPGGRAPSAAQLALIAAQHHDVTLLAMLLGGVMALLGTIAVTDPHPRGQALTMLPMPIPLLVTMALSIQLVTPRSAGIAVLAVVIGVGTYLRTFAPRFGSRVVLYGVLLFIGYLFGFASGGAITERDLGPIAVIAWLAVLINLLLKVVVYRPLNRGRLERISRTFRARARTVVAGAADLFDAAEPRARTSRRLHRRLVRLDETALVIDASLAAPGALPPGVSALDAHARLFEVERLIDNVARLTEQLAAAELPQPVREAIREWLGDLRTGHGERVARAVAGLERDERAVSLAGVAESDVAAIHLLAGDIAETVGFLGSAPSRAGARSDADNMPFESAVTLIAGDLPGSAIVSAQAAAVEGRRAVLPRLRLDPAARMAIRVAVAAAVASALGSVVSEHRFYWAVLAVFVTFMGTNTSGEQVIKAIHRVAGTIVGVLIGSLLANAIGHSTWSVAVIIGALGLGIYFFNVSFAAFVTALTIALAQLYSQLGEYSNHLLALRLEETAVGGAVAIAAAIWIFPVATRRAARIAERAYLGSLAELLGQVGDHLREQPGDAPLSSASRALDHAHQQLLTTARPLARNPWCRDRIERTLSLYTQTAHDARNLVADVTRENRLDPRVAPNR